MSHEVSEQQAIINELQQHAMSREDQDYLKQLQDEHNQARERLGRPAEDPALQHIARTATQPTVVYKVDSAGHVHNPENAEDHGPYSKGRRS
jgi:hypothetical protein